MRFGELLDEAAKIKNRPPLLNWSRFTGYELHLEYDVRDAAGTFEVGVRIFWRGVREKGGSSEPPPTPNPPGYGPVRPMTVWQTT